MTFPLDRVRDRYLNDATFHAMVDAMIVAVMQLELAPSELREAAMLASIMVEERSPKPFRKGCLFTAPCCINRSRYRANCPKDCGCHD